MHLMLSILGGLLVLFVYVDVLWTTMGQGGGPFTTRIMSGVWKALLSSQRRFGATRLLSSAGIIITILAVVLWILFLWMGWVLVFYGTEGAIVHAQTNTPAGFWEQVYFTGFTIFTLGMGDYVPAGLLWEVLTAVSAISGLFLVTFSITFLIPIVQSATRKCQLAVYIRSIGRTPGEIVRHTWSDGNCEILAQHLPSLTSELVMLKQRHLTYPALHYFHSRDDDAAVALGVAALDEALTIIEYGLESQGRYCMAPGVYRPTRQAINAFLSTLSTAFIEPAHEPPPPPSLAGLREQGLPVVDEAVFRERVAKLSDHRRLLLGLVENDGWRWDLLDDRG